jgi:hypothetical protein
VKAHLANLFGFGQRNVNVEVEHRESIVRYLEVSNKGSLGLDLLDLVKVLNAKFEVEH